MKTINELKQGDKIYDLDFRKIKWYTYFCVHPNNENYHILIDAGQEPIRIYKDRLEVILSQGFETYDNALLELANRLKEDSDDIFEKLLKRIQTE